MEEKKVIKVRISTVVLSILLILALIVIGILGYKYIELKNEKTQCNENIIINTSNSKNNSVGSQNTTTISNTINTSITKEKDYESYDIKIGNVEIGEKKSYKINDYYTVYIDVKEVYDTDFRADVYVNNGEKIYNDLFLYNEFKVLIWNDYLIYMNNDVTDLRQNKWFIIDKTGSLVKEIYELDESNKGMLAIEVNFKSTAIVVKGSRIGPGSRVNYKDYGSADCIDVATIKNTPADTIVEATYTYNIVNGTIDFNKPEISVVKRFKQHVEDNKEEIIRELKNFDKENYKEGIVEEFLKNN